MSEVTLFWLQDLCTRHQVTLQTRGKAFLITPKSAYNALLTTDERATLKAQKAAILAIVKAEGGTIRGTLGGSQPRPPIETPPLPPPYCAYCMRAPCIGPEHEAYRILHVADPSEVQRRAQHERDQREAYRRGWPLPSMIPDEPPESDTARQQRDVRERLGWETPGGTVIVTPDGGARRR